MGSRQSLFFRRDFLKSMAAAGTVASLPTISYRRILGANDRVRIGVIGLNGRGKDHFEGLKEHVVALCDCDSVILGQMAEGKGLATYTDYRKLCESPDIDAVTIATPNHTHALIAITAMAAGKDVYVEKPVSHNVREGRLLVRAAEQTGRICQCGTQSRSNSALQEAVAFVREGSLGPVQYAIGTCYKPRKSIGRLTEPLTIPETLDYDLWCGPAEMRPLLRPNLHYDWHWDFNTGNGDMGNQGIHQMDIARWFLGYQQLSPRVLSVGGRLGYEDAGNTPNTQTVLHDYPDAPIVFETRGLPRGQEFQEGDLWAKNMDEFRGSRVGVLVQCERGHLHIPDYSSARAFDLDGNEIRSWAAEGDHYGNFLAAVRSRDPALTSAPPVEGHLSSALCHTGNLSHLHGRNVSPEELRAAVERESPLFRDSVERMMAHLAANGVDLSTGSRLMLGGELRMDPAEETILNHPAACEDLSRECRPGFDPAAVLS